MKRTDTPDAPIGLLIGVTRLRLKRRLLRDLDRHAVTPAQMGILLKLYNEEGLSASEIAQRTLMDQPMITRVLDRLERGGLVERKRDPTDRRRIRVWSTRKARRLAPSLEAIARRVNEELLRNLGRAEQIELRRLLFRLIENLEEVE